MNNACLIAATVTSRRNNKPKEYATYFTTDNFDLYYRVNFRMYFHFNSLKAVTPIKEPLTNPSGGFIPESVTYIKPLIIEGRTIAKSHSFPLKADKCKDGPDKYVEANLERYTTSSVWDNAKEEIIEMYLEGIKDTYGITLERNSISYTTQYCWEIECE